MKLSINNISKIVGVIIGILLFVLLITGITYAWFTWKSSNINITGSSACFTVDYTKGPNISNEDVILFDESKIISNNQITIKEGMALTAVTAGIKSTCTISGDLIINLNVTTLNNAYISGNSVGAFKYILASYDPNTYTTISTSALSGQKFDIIKTESITSTGSITITSETLSTTKKGFLIIFYVDGDLVNNDAGGSSFSATIEAVARQVES